MFNNRAPMQKLTTEILVNVASFLDIRSILQLSLSCKQFSHLIKEDLVFKHLVQRDYHVTEKNDDQTWLQIYQQHAKPAAAAAVTDTTMTEASTSAGSCTHFVQLTETAKEIKRLIYRSEEKYPCDLCLDQPATYLNMHNDNYNGACLSCLSQPIKDEDHFPIQLDLTSGDLCCFECGNGRPHKLTGERDGKKVQEFTDYIKTSDTFETFDRRRKAEQQLYVQELRREDMSLKHYLVEKQWGRAWMTFRTREGAPPPTKITQQRIARMNGSLDPNIRLPMDKYRPSPETHGDIVSEKLWRCLSKIYGVQGRAYSEDDIIAPEYARIRVYVDDFKKSIHLYP